MQITRGKIQRPQKTVIYGPEGIGKTTLAAAFPNPLFIDTEGGTNHLDAARMDRPTSWAMLMDQVRYVAANPDVCGTLVIDTADWAEQLCMVELCARSQKSGIEDFGYGKGYVYLAEAFGKLLTLLEEVVDKGVHVVMTAHATMRKFEQPDEMGAYDRWEMKLQKKTGPLVKEWADLVLFANYKTYVVNVDNQGVQKGKNKAQGGARVLYTSHHPCWDAKNRHGLPDELPLTFEAIAQLFSAAEMPAARPAKEPPASPEPAPVPSTPEPQTIDAMPPVVSPAPPPAPALDPPPSGIPRALQDLMSANNVTEAEIQAVVAQRGYYPRGMPIVDYDAGFIEGVLIGAWDQVFEMIRANREPTPF